MTLQHTETAPTPACDTATLGRVTALAQHLQDESRGLLSADQMEAIGEEVGVGREYIEAALRQVALAEARGQVRIDLAREFRQLLAGWGIALVGGAAGVAAASLGAEVLAAYHIIVAPFLAIGAGMLVGRRRGAAAAALVLAILLAAVEQGVAGWVNAVFAVLVGGAALPWLASQGVRLREHYFPSLTSTQPASTALLGLLEKVHRRLDREPDTRFVLSLELVGAAQLARNSPPGQFEQTSARFREWAAQIVRHGGGELQPGEEGVLHGLFTSDRAATGAARELLQGVDRFNADWNRLSSPIRLRCGIAAGSLVDGLDPQHGTAGRRAGELRRRADPGDILLPTALAAAGLLELHDLAPLSTEPGEPPIFSWQAGLRRHA